VIASTLRRALRLLLASDSAQPIEPPAWEGYPLLQRVLAGLLGVRLHLRSDTTRDVSEAETAEVIPAEVRSKIRFARDILHARHTINRANKTAGQLAYDRQESTLREFFSYVHQLRLELGTVYRGAITQSSGGPETSPQVILIDPDAIKELQNQVTDMQGTIDLDKMKGLRPNSLETIVDFFRKLRPDILRLNLSDLDLRGLKFADEEHSFWYDDLSGAIWTHQTQWPSSIAEGILDSSDEMSPGVYQVRFGTERALSRG
jgi:hypothetical protein